MMVPLQSLHSHQAQDLSVGAIPALMRHAWDVFCKKARSLRQFLDSTALHIPLDGPSVSCSPQEHRANSAVPGRKPGYCTYTGKNKHRELASVVQITSLQAARHPGTRAASILHEGLGSYLWSWENT